MKKTISLILCIAMAVSMFAMTAAFAVDDSESEVVPYTIGTPSAMDDNFDDGYGNIYYVYGFVTAAGAKGKVVTRYEIKEYANPNDPSSAKNRTKTLKAGGEVTFTFGGNDSFTLKTESSMGATGILENEKTFRRSILSIYGSHVCMCNGRSTSLATDIVFDYIPTTRVGEQEEK